jgi:hypothetical protein
LLDQEEPVISYHFIEIMASPAVVSAAASAKPNLNAKRVERIEAIYVEDEACH